MHWPFLEKSGPKKWVVGATLALKQNFLAGTLILTCNIYTVPFTSTVSQKGWKAKVFDYRNCYMYSLFYSTWEEELREGERSTSPTLPLPVTLFYLPCLSFIYTVILRNIVGKNAHSNPERYFGWFLVHGSSQKVWKDGMRGHGCMFASAKAINP